MLKGCCFLLFENRFDSKYIIASRIVREFPEEKNLPEVEKAQNLSPNCRKVAFKRSFKKIVDYIRFYKTTFFEKPNGMVILRFVL